MTDIDKLEAGHKLNMLVAENVMGWKRLPYRKPKHSGGMAWPHPYPRPWPYGTRWMLPRGVTTSDMVPWSTDIAAALEVVESDRWVLDDWAIIRADHIEYKYEVWDLTGWELSTGLIARGRTAPHAICLAALKAVSDD